MNALTELLNRLTDEVLAQSETFDNALFVLQSWVSRNAPLLTSADRAEFSRTLASEESPQERAGQPYGDDQTLVSSILRLHAMRLLYRYDAEHDAPLTGTQTDPSDSSPYGRATAQLRQALRTAERAINEARIDAAIANAHQIMGDSGANHRWLQDALARLQTAAKTDLIRLVESIPTPPAPQLNLWQKAMFGLFRIEASEIGRRNLRSLRQLAELQNSQVIEMARLLVASFEAINDMPGATQALALITRLQSS